MLLKEGFKEKDSTPGWDKTLLGGYLTKRNSPPGKDKTLFPKNQILPEEHMTFVSPSGYISHEVLESKKSADVSKKIIKTIDDTNSRQSLKILAMDGEAVNTGVHTG